ncbi:MAG TPA: expansin EXLX1 family cellulose-binding protein, partial [Polyangiaceae bacterium]
MPGSAGGSNDSPTSSGGKESAPATTVVTTEKFGEPHSGDGTYYTFADGSGACLYDKTSDFQIAALNGFDWAGSAWCGACVDVTGPNGNQLRVRIVDECPDCAKGQLDFHPDAFAVLAPKEQGRVAISWSFVACDAVGPVSYKFKDGSNPFWTAVQVRNSRFPIAKLETSKDGVSFVEAQRQDYNYFLNGAGFGAGATQVRISAPNGATLTDTLPEVKAELIVAGLSQFQ